MTKDRRDKIETLPSPRPDQYRGQASPGIPVPPIIKSDNKPTGQGKSSKK